MISLKPPLGLVDPVLDQAGGRDVFVLLAEFMGGAQLSRQLPVVVTKFSEHVLGRDKFGVVVLQALMLRDITNGVNRRRQGRARGGKFRAQRRTPRAKRAKAI
jgi:hypothetical protein